MDIFFYGDGEDTVKDINAAEGVIAAPAENSSRMLLL
jgi:hypothetical protein